MSGLPAPLLDGVFALDCVVVSSWGVGECARLVFFLGGILNQKICLRAMQRHSIESGWKREVELRAGRGNFLLSKVRALLIAVSVAGPSLTRQNICSLNMVLQWINMIMSWIHSPARAFGDSQNSA